MSRPAARLLVIFGLVLLFLWAGESQAANPSISSLSPTSGAIGASITVSGSGFGSSQGSSTIKFNGVTATATSWKNTTIAATVPSGATTGNVVVTVGSNSSNGVSFTVVPAPSITSLSPTSAAIGGSVTIAGSSFGSSQSSGTVKFNGTTATVTSWNATSIVATVPSGATTGNVVVFASGVNSNGVSFIVVPAPSISSLSVTSGTVGTAVTIAGTNFGATQGAGTVSFNGVLATVSSWSATSIQTTVPSTASTGNVVVFASGVNSNGKTFTVTPTIGTLWGNSGIVGATVYVQGSGFGSTQGTSTVKFYNGKTATISAWGPNYITAIVPTGATTGNVTVTVAGTTSNGVLFTVGTAPVINSISPNSGAAPSTVVIAGSFFGAYMQSSYVSFNGVVARPSSWSNTSIVTPIPYQAGSGPVTVVVNNVASNGVMFTWNVYGVISGKVTRSSDGSPVVGAQVQAFQPVTETTASTTTAGDGSYSVVNLLAVSDTELGQQSGWPYDVNVYVNGYLAAKHPGALINPGQTTTVNLTIGVPTIASLSPSSGPIGSAVTITGTNFGLIQGSSAVSFNGTVASPTSWNNARIVVPVPSGASTGPVVVTLPAQASNGVTFTVGVGALTGTITNSSNGSAISGASVQAVQSNTVQGSTTSAADGTYTIGNLSAGTFDLRVSASGFGTSIVPNNSVVAGSPTTVNAALSSAGTISGSVTQSDGVTPISGASVVVNQGSDTAGSATTDSNGVYAVSSLSSGTYAVQASAFGFNSQTQTGIAVTANNTTTLNLSLSGQSAISYFYDTEGRLIGVSNSSSNTAAYSYDLVGNLVSITNNSTSQLSIIGFDPQSGSVGTQVTIGGTGFSSNMSQDTVTFNGTSAIVTSASSTQLVATVPSGAMTGPISVRTPNGSVTSSSSFGMGGNPNGPSISGFSPTLVAAGTALTINGNNFSTTPANDLTTINRSAAASITSATQTSVSATVPPSATTGYISVKTPTGSAITNSYLFVVPSGYTVSQVNHTGTLAFQSPATLNFTSVSQVALLAFDGTAGQRVIFNLAPVSSSDSNVFSVTLMGPAGNALSVMGANGNPQYSPVITLPQSGTYTVLTVLTRIGTTNSLTLTLYNVPPDVTASITPSGPPVTVTTTAIGQNAGITFPETVGRRISFILSNSSYSPSPIFNLLAPDSSSVALTPGGCGFNCLAGPITLAETGIYTIALQTNYGGRASTGSVTLALWDVPADVAGTVSINGAVFPVTISTPGQGAEITFSGTAGQSVTVRLSSNNICFVDASLLPPGGGSALASNESCAASFSLPSETLPTTGTYTIAISIYGNANINNYTGSVAVAVTSP